MASRTTKAHRDKWRKAHPEKIREYNHANHVKNYPIHGDAKKEQLRARHAVLKKRIYDHYGHVCACCGEANPYFLSVDHINNDSNKDRTRGGFRRSGTPLYVKIIANGFPPTFQILCMNCNHGKSRNGGVCPHNIPDNGTHR